MSFELQASSAESERQFSSGGVIVNERRSRLSHKSVKSLVVLREAYLNEMWPKRSVNDSPENHQDQKSQLQESVSIASIADSENLI